MNAPSQIVKSTRPMSISSVHAKRKTLQVFFLLACFVIPAQSALRAAPLVPPALSPGDKYHLVFATSTLHQGNFGDGTYAPGGNLTGAAAGDFIVNSATVGGNQPTALTNGATYKAILSDSSRNANSVVTDSSPIYNVAGQLVATSYANMFQGSSTLLVNAIQFDEFGNSATFGAWTGSNSSGNNNGQTCGDWTGSAGPCTRGAPVSNSSSWVDSGANSSFVQGLRLYGISNELMVPVPEPTSLATLLVGTGITLLTARRHGKRIGNQTSSHPNAVV